MYHLKILERLEETRMQQWQMQIPCNACTRLLTNQACNLIPSSGRQQDRLLLHLLAHLLVRQVLPDFPGQSCQNQRHHSWPQAWSSYSDP